MIITTTSKNVVDEFYRTLCHLFHLVNGQKEKGSIEYIVSFRSKEECKWMAT